MNPVKEHVLVVDDEPQVLVALEDLLEDRFVVSKVDSGEEALSFLDRVRDVAVLITDQRMPEMTGDELLRKLGPGSDTQRIMVTGYADLAAVVRAVNEGQLFAYVTKPWNEEDLLLKVLKASEQFRLTQELATERRLLQEQTHVLNAVLDGIGDGVIVSDQSGRFLIFNPEARRILGVRGKPVPLAEWSKAYGVYESDRKTPLRPSNDPLVRAVDGHESREIELFVRNDHVSGASVVMSATSFRTENGKARGGIAVLRDVTERRQLEAQLFQSQKMEAIGQLAGGVAHDFNNLLSVIHSYGEMLLLDLPDDPQMKEDMNELLGAAQRASALTKQLLTFSREQPVKRASIDLNALIENMEKMLRRLIGSRVELSSRLSPRLGAVTADETQVEQILLNLVVNARDAMPEGGRLTIETDEVLLNDVDGDGTFSGRFACMSVTDTGSGMSEEVKKRLFDPFFTTKPVGKGTGLGLSTVYGIVRSSGGQVTVESELGHGSRFRVYLPLTAESRASSVEGSMLPVAFGRETILIVEDEEPVRRVATRILRERGYTVLEAASAEEARRLFARHAAAIELLIVDAFLEDSSGVELVHELEAQTSGARVLYLAAQTPPTGPGAIRPAEEWAYLEKPFTPDRLANAVRTSLGRPSLE